LVFACRVKRERRDGQRECGHFFFTIPGGRFFVGSVAMLNSLRWPDLREAGVVASLARLRASVVSGGVLCVVGVALAALALPAFRRYDDRRDAPPVARVAVARE
jgi:hypothetical protein